MNEEIRTLDFLSWKQESAWMESMKGNRWKNLLKQENETFKIALDKVVESNILENKIEEFQKKFLFFKHNDIVLKYINGNTYEYSINKDTYIVTDFDKVDNLIYQIRDTSSGAESYTLECVNKWSFNNIAPNFYIYKNSIFVLKAKNKLQYYKLIELNRFTGEIIKTHYEEHDNTFNLAIIKTEDTFFMIRDNYSIQNCFVYQDSLKQIGDEKATAFFPVGINNKVCYFQYLNKEWKSVGFDFPFTIYGSIEYFSLKYKLFIERRFGRRTIYSYDKKLKPIYSYYGTLITNQWTYNLDTFYIDTMDKGYVELSYNKDFTIKNCPNPYGIFKHHFYKSFDNTNIPCLTLKPYCEVKGLMVIGYGAYNMETNLSMWRWKPYLDDGWLISFLLIRGSGDHTIEWANQGKTVKKVTGIHDFEYGIRYLQKEYKISYNKTCIYGRSAGGYLIGSTLSRNPNGKLFKMVYTEVPYVDILRTTTNPTLPLTTLEYNEFGNPRESIFEFQELLKISPVDTLDYNNPPEKIFVLVRTSENDSEVYTYESLKWIEALRGKNKNDSSKLIYISKNEGHFTSQLSIYKNLAEDFFLLKNSRDNGRK